MTHVHSRLPAEHRFDFRAPPGSRVRRGIEFFRIRRPAVPSNLLTFQSQDIELLTKLGEQTSSASSATPQEAATAYLRAAAQELGSTLPGRLDEEAASSSVQIQLMEGRVKSGDLADTSVVLKVYPPDAGSDADLLFRNELQAHSSLQQQFLGAAVPGSDRIAHLLGCFWRPAGEQVLVFRKDSGSTAVECCRHAAEQFFTGAAAAGPDREEAMRRQKRRIKTAMCQLLEGLAFMHRRQRVHRRLTPANLLLDWRAGEPAAAASARLLDLSLSADVSDAALMGGATLAALWHGQKERENPLKALAEPLWARAAAAGADSAKERQLFAVAEDVASAGLLVAFLAFAPLCPPGSLDFATVQRLLGVTFAAQLGAAREFFAADERWAAGVAFLDEDGGWELVQAMTFPDFRLRPAAEACLTHRFLAAAADV